MLRDSKVILFIVLAGLSQSILSGNVKLGWPGSTLLGHECYGADSGYGPYNYVTQAEKIGIVEQYHFTSEVEQLIRGKSSTIDGDLDYTLRAIPNHHHALWAKARYYMRNARALDELELSNVERAKRGYAPPECYFQRALLFAPKDGMVPAIFGIYLQKRGKLDDALVKYRAAETIFPDNPELMYNMGLLYVDLKDFDAAKRYAERARKLGYPLTGLQKKIERLDSVR